MPYETIIYEKKGGLVDITLNRPDRLNAANLQLAREMHEAVGEIEADQEARVVVLHGAGREPWSPPRTETWVWCFRNTRCSPI